MLRFLSVAVQRQLHRLTKTKLHIFGSEHSLGRAKYRAPTKIRCASKVAFYASFKPKGAGSFHIHRKTMKELGALAVLGIHVDSRVPGLPCHYDLILTSKSAIFDPPPRAHEGRMAGAKTALNHVFLLVLM